MDLFSSLPIVLRRIILNYLHCSVCNKLCEFNDISLTFEIAYLSHACDDGHFIEFSLWDDNKDVFVKLESLNTLRINHGLCPILIKNYFNKEISIKLYSKDRVTLPDQLEWQYNDWSYGCVDVCILNQDKKKWDRLIPNLTFHFMDLKLFNFCIDQPEFDFDYLEYD